MKVRLTLSARVDVAAIADYIKKDSPARALAVIEDLQKRAIQIGSRPKSYPLAQGLEELNIRRRIHKRYLIFFRIESDHIAILRIVHGARDYEALFSPDA